jgi:2-oxoglutarate ferredoxin oxidoreductase subunit alpha
VRGGHNFFQIRLADRPVGAPREAIDILVALDRTSIPRYEQFLSAQGIAVYDSKALNEKHRGERFLDIPFVYLAVTHGGSRVMANAVATGAVLGMLGMDLDLFLEAIRDQLGKKGEETVAANLKAAQAGYDFAGRECLRCEFSLSARENGRMLIAGNDAIGLGAVVSGCKFYAAYPMTPSTGIMNFIAGKAKEYGIIVEQAEDEIAAINMVLGASFGGVRAMTGSSGGGFALMAEGVSLAGMTETPVVIAVAQRPGPATGLPTRTEQAELLFVLHAGHGEFPRVIMAPGSPEQAFYLTNRAFDLAERYQIPVFILTDQYLADSEWTYEDLDFGKLVYEDHRLRGDAFRGLPVYKRHAFTETGVSMLGVPGEADHLVITDSDEHSEEGHIIEDAETRRKMTEKRLFLKMPLIRKEISPPGMMGSREPEIVLAGWGSTYGVIKEVVDLLGESKKIAMLHFGEVYPLPERDRLDYLAILKRAKLTIAVENNATNQFAYLFRAETGYSFDMLVNKYDGRPFTVEGLLGEINGYIEGL